MGFNTLTKRVAEATGAELANIEPDDFQVPAGTFRITRVG
jgi:DNA polymerase-1